MYNFAIYDGFISILTEILREINPDVTRYDAVRLTAPDMGLLWHVSALAPVEHFMEDCKTNINNECDNILSLITNHNESFVNDMEKSFDKVYTYQFYEYFHKMFEEVLTISPNEKRELYDRIVQIIRILCNTPSLTGILETNGLNKFLNDCYHSGSVFDCEIDAWIDYVTICFHKIICAIFFACDHQQHTYSVVPAFASLTEMFKGSILIIERGLNEAANEEAEIKLYEDLYDLILGSHEDIQNWVAYKFYVQFFSFINRVEIQDKILFNNPNQYEKIFSLYDLFYTNVKYKLYRAYGSNTALNSGIMRNSLPDRQIVLNYLAKYSKDASAEYNFFDNSSRRFVIRLANDGDKDRLTNLSNPTPPYRRAIFIRFNQTELAEAIARKQLWIIEEEYNGERVLACSAIILYNDQNCNYKSFYAGEMNEKYCKKHYKSGENMPLEYKFIDFDSIIVDDGRTNVYRRSYRGCGFQRLMLILAEEIAKLKACDYICATVSSFNKPSECNFMLNGYKIEDDTNYPFKENDPSPFYEHIFSPLADEKIKKKFYDDLEYEVVAYKNILVKLKIAEEDYRRDMNVPREFVVLNLK